MDNKEKIKLQEKKIREKREQNTTKKTPDTKDFDRQTYIEKLTKFVTEEEEKNIGIFITFHIFNIMRRVIK